MCRRPAPDWPGRRYQLLGEAKELDPGDVGRARPLVSVGELELHLLALGQSLVALDVLWCTKTSLPSSSSIKPYPLASWNHLTFPLDIRCPPEEETSHNEAPGRCPIG